MMNICLDIILEQLLQNLPAVEEKTLGHFQKEILPNSVFGTLNVFLRQSFILSQNPRTYICVFTSKETLVYLFLLESCFRLFVCGMNNSNKYFVIISCLKLMMCYEHVMIVIATILFCLITACAKLLLHVVKTTYNCTAIQFFIQVIIRMTLG